jgi:hypothetical protein
MWKVRLLGEGGVWNRKDESIAPQIAARPKRSFMFFPYSGVQNGFKIASGNRLVAVLQVMNILSSIPLSPVNFLTGDVNVTTVQGWAK